MQLLLLKTVVPLDEKETGGSLFDKLSKAGADLLLETLDALENGTVTPQKQGESPTAYAKMLTKDMGAIDWNRPAKELERLIRGLNPLEDVVGFIENAGQNYKCSGCWKVYCNECETRKLFAKYKKCREVYRRLWKQGRDIRTLTVAS